jgi:hypothetical protein
MVFLRDVLGGYLVNASVCCGLSDSVENLSVAQVRAAGATAGGWLRGISLRNWSIIIRAALCAACSHPMRMSSGLSRNAERKGAPGVLCEMNKQTGGTTVIWRDEIHRPAKWQCKFTKNSGPVPRNQG